ncbi:MAG: hypothetical protein JO092_06545 [Candidatus Eremiobacteraeota bacterium]|nr:hypothetical protein [Candidatus Eremiobacteraeota bacterium]
MQLYRRFIGPALLVLVAACSGSNAGFAPAATSATQQSVHAGYRILDFTYHVMPLRTSARPAVASARKIIYPDDLTNLGGPIMSSEAAHNIYVNCPARNQSCWGAPEAFQTKLTGSSFAALLRQYTKSGPNSLTFADSTAVTYKVYPGTALYENDLFAIIHQVASSTRKTGYANLYHVFLTKGTSTCIDFTTSCYSPGNASTSGFCAYHGSVKYSDIGTVIYTVEPYQNIRGCLTKKSSGASQLTNSTISTLAHETFESVTDPGPRLAWINFVGGEIGDECEFFVVSVTLAGTVYNTQPMYSNKYHGCTASP